MTRSDLQQLATIRLDEAQLLLQAGRFSGAYYLAGYAVECGLKAAIAKETQQYDFPDQKRVQSSHTHDLKALLALAALDDELKNSGYAKPALAANWQTVVNWSEKSRYELWSEAKARSLLLAIADADAGVFPWLSTHW